MKNPIKALYLGRLGDRYCEQMVEWLNQYLTPAYAVQVYPMEGNNTRQQLRAYIDAHHIELLIGEAEGADLALSIGKLPKVVVNPTHEIDEPSLVQAYYMALNEDSIRETIAPYIDRIWEKMAHLQEWTSNADNIPLYDTLL